MEERVAFQASHLRRACRQINVKVAIAINVAEVRAHRTEGPGESSFFRYIGERAIAVVPIKHLPVCLIHCLASELRSDERNVGTGIGNENIQIAIVIVVKEKGDERIGDSQIHARFRCHVGECPIAVVPIEDVLCAVVDNVNINVAIVIVIAPGGAE